MGVSPYYRGSSCNFWAIEQGNYDLVGSTIHLLSKGLDSGAMLYHAFAKSSVVDPFVHGMLPVKAAHLSLVQTIASGEVFDMEPVKQDRTKEISYTKSRDFDDAVSGKHLEARPSPQEFFEYFNTRPGGELLRPLYVDTQQP